MDPVHAAVLALGEAAPFGTVIDFGCGRGQVAVALLEAGAADSVRAFDHDAGALAQLRLAAAGLPLEAEAADLARPVAVGMADTVLLIDVLYQLASAPQMDLLRRAAGLARRTVVIRATDPAAGWRSALSATLERVGRRVWPTFGERANPLPVAHLVDALAGCGFAVSVTPCAQGTPLAGVLIVGRATPALAAAAP